VENGQRHGRHDISPLRSETQRSAARDDDSDLRMLFQEFGNEWRPCEEMLEVVE
jgi:hypothetical protein